MTLREQYPELRRPHIIFVGENETEVALHTKCLGCGKVMMFQLSREQVVRWCEGGFVQDIWPRFTDGQREALMSGTCDPCYDKWFPPDE